MAEVISVFVNSETLHKGKEGELIMREFREDERLADSYMCVK